MPLSLDDFPDDRNKLLELILAAHGTSRGFERSSQFDLNRLVDDLQRFHDDFVTQLLPANDVIEYCKETARLINETLFVHLIDSRPAMWDVAQEILQTGGLRSFGLLDETEFYKYAGADRPAYDLANQVFIRGNQWK